MMASKVLELLAAVAIIVIALGFYESYRDKQTAVLTHLTSLSQIQNVPPAVCTYEVGAYGLGSGGTMYVANGRIRVDVLDLENGGYSGNLEAVIGLDGTREMDPKSAQALSGGKGAAFALNMVITEAPWKCSPWWFSDNGLFTIPNAVPF